MHIAVHHRLIHSMGLHPYISLRSVTTISGGIFRILYVAKRENGVHSRFALGYEVPRTFAALATSCGLTQKMAPYRFAPAQTASIAVTLILASANLVMI